MRAAVLLAVLTLLLSGCGSSRRSHVQTEAGVVGNASCVSEPVAHAPLPGESGVYQAGPLTLSVGEDLAQLRDRQLGQPLGSETIALVTGDQPVVLRVDPASRALMALQFTPGFPGAPDAVIADGLRAVRFPACGGTAHRFNGGVLFAGRGCVRLEVSPENAPPSTMLIPIGNTLQGCPDSAPFASLPVSALPFLGVACGKPSSIRCDRIGVGVTLDRHATLVVVQVAGRLVTLSPPTPGSNIWLGYLQGAGPAHGPLRVRSPTRSGLWFGSPEMYPAARATAFFPNGSVASSSAAVLLHPGFG